MLFHLNLLTLNVLLLGLLLVFISNEYSYFAQNSVRIIEDSDNRSSDNQGSTVLASTAKVVGKPNGRGAL